MCRNGSGTSLFLLFFLFSVSLLGGNRPAFCQFNPKTPNPLGKNLYGGTVTFPDGSLGNAVGRAITYKAPDGQDLADIDIDIDLESFGFGSQFSFSRVTVHGQKGASLPISFSSGVLILGSSIWGVSSSSGHLELDFLDNSGGLYKFSGDKLPDLEW